MKRRQFITLLGGAAATWPLATRAQQPERMRRIGVLTNLAADDPESQARIGALLQGLQEFGWSIGRNVRIDYRWAAGDAGRLRSHAAELVALAPDVILANANPSVEVLQQTARAMPIVFVAVTDPVGTGVVASLARPGGNTTGFTSAEFSMSAKWLELLKEVAPGVTRAAVLQDPGNPGSIPQFAAIQSVAPSLGVDLSTIFLRDAGEIEGAVAAFARAPNGGLIATRTSGAIGHRNLIITQAAKLGCRRSTPCACSSPRAAWPPTDLILSTSVDARPPTSIASSRARSQPTCRFRRRPNTSWSSTSRPRRRSALQCLTLCSPAPTRSSNDETPRVHHAARRSGWVADGSTCATADGTDNRLHQFQGR